MPLAPPANPLTPLADEQTTIYADTAQSVRGNLFKRSDMRPVRAVGSPRPGNSGLFFGSAH